MAQKTPPDIEQFINESPISEEDYPFWLKAPFRLLTDITQFRKIDPWDLEVADLITKFVEKMKLYNDINFPVLGRAILSAAILYRTKVTDLIKIIESIDDKQEGDLDMLEFDIPEISPSYHISQRPVTFNELIYAFQGLLKQESSYKYRLAINQRRALIQPLSIPLTPIKVVDEESTKTAILKKEIYTRLVQLHTKYNRPIFFEELLPPNSTRVSVIRSFLCILFLGFELKAILSQKEDLGRIQLTPLRDKEEEFLGGFEKVIEAKLKESTPLEGSVTITEISEEELFLEESNIHLYDESENIFEDDEEQKDV